MHKCFLYKITKHSQGLCSLDLVVTPQTRSTKGPSAPPSTAGHPRGGSRENKNKAKLKLQATWSFPRLQPASWCRDLKGICHKKLSKSPDWSAEYDMEPYTCGNRGLQREQSEAVTAGTQHLPLPTGTKCLGFYKED